MHQKLSINSRHPWTRHWHVQDSTRGHTADDADESSFLRLPWLASEEASPVQTLTDLLRRPAVILLGRPGAGKSTELEMLLKGQQTYAGHQVVYFDAKACSADPAALFTDPEWPADKTQPVLLVLDGVDELLMEFPRYAEVFARRLGQERQSRPLRLVLSCRHAEWPETLDIWQPSEELVTARLCQLTRQAAESFVSAHLGAKAQAFWEQVERQKIEFMAVWPHSLGELVAEFAENGALPSSHFKLLEKASLRRCNPNDTDSERAKRHPDKSVDVRWYHRIAGRLAALSCFSGRHKLTANIIDTACIALSDLDTQPEPWIDGYAKPITEPELRALFKTPMFMPLAGDRCCFSHQMFREFMAAYWIAERGITLPQLQSLFGMELEGRWRHYPQLAAIAAWLASNPAQTAWQDFLIENDPAILLRADAAALPDTQKKRITKALLDQAVADRAVDRGWHHRHLRSLACPGLTEVLKPYLLNYNSTHEAARLLAIDIVEEAQVREAAPFLWEAVRKPQTRLRSQIAYALQQIASEGYDTEWQAVIDGEIPLDEHGSLLGAALLALVPRKLKVRDVLEYLLPQRDFGIIGLFTDACNDMTERMEKADAKAVVRKSAQSNTWGITPSGNVDKPTLVSKALCWLAEDLDDPESLQVFAEWWLASVRDFRGVSWNSKPLNLRDLKFDQASIRRRVLDACIHHSSSAIIRSQDLFWGLFRKFIQTAADLEWLIAGSLDGDARAKSIYATWLREAFYASDLTESQKAALLDAWNKSEVLRSKLPAVQDGENVLAAIERERSKFQAEMLASEESFRVSMEAQEAERRARLEKIVPLTLEDHRRFLLKASPPFPLKDEQERLRTGFAAVDALQAVWSTLGSDPQLQAAITEDWLAHILNQMQRGYGVEDDFTLPALLMRFAPQSLRAMLRIVIHNYLHHGGLHELKLLDPFASEVTAKIKQMLVDYPVQVEGFMNAHAWLARLDPAAAKEVILHWIAQIALKSTEPAHLMVLASTMANLGGKLWPQIRPYVCADRQITCQVLTLAFGRSHDPFASSNPATEWDADYLSDVAELFFTSFSQEKNWWSGERQSQSKLVSILEERGMTSTLQRLIRLGLKDSQPWLWAAHQRAMASRIASEWPAVSPADLLQLAKDHDFSLVRDDSSLQTAVLLALERYQLDLKTSDHGKKLFNDDGTPRIENALTDHLKQWLEDKLHLNSYREVKTFDDKREDLHISLSRPAASLTIEVKKHNSADLRDKMESQLLKLYLEHNQLTHGIYLVFWFEDGTENLEQVTAELTQQAAKLSQPPYQIRAKVLDCRPQTLKPADPHTKSTKSKAGKKKGTKKTRAKKTGRRKP